MVKNTRYFLYILSILMSIGVFFLFTIYSNTDVSFYAKNGTLDLENWNKSANPIIKLNGEWLFYTTQLAQDLSSNFELKNIPHFWESDSELNSPFGFGTYKLKLTGLKPSEIYGIHIMDEVTAYTLYANNERIASNGIVSSQRTSYKPQWHPIFAVFKADENGTVELVMEIANFNYYRGGFWNSLRIGKVETLFSQVSLEKTRELFLFTSIFIVGFINLILFMIYKTNKATLYFALFCFSMSFRTLLIGQRLITDMLPNLNWNILVRLEYFFGYLLLPLFSLFLLHLYDIIQYQIFLKRFFYIFIFVFSLTAIIIPNNLYAYLLEPYKWIGLLFCLYFAYFIYVANKKKHAGALLMLFAVIGMFIAILKETFIENLVSWMPFATLNFILCFSFITLKRFLIIIRKNEMLEAKIIRDPLTGLYNRSYIMEIDENYFKPINHQKKYVMFLDLDHFKTINDTYGHKIGDFILQEAGARFKSIIRNTDILCRYGGDEFIIIITVSSLDEVINVAQRIIKEIEVPFEKDGMSYQVGVSIGIVKCQKDIHNIEVLIKMSDEAMYQAKNKGRNQYFIYS